MLKFLVDIWNDYFGEWKAFLEPKISPEEITLARERGSTPSFGFFFLLSTATAIATFGLLANSAAVIIGAMLVAPLMNPILSMSYGITTGNQRLYRRSILTIIFGTAQTVLLSYLLSRIISIPTVASEILARSEPNLLDLGIAIAAGAAGAFSLTRQSIANSIAGVAISVALVPPLCVAGIGIEMGNAIAYLGPSINSGQLWLGALLLFLTNLAAISFSSCLVFLGQSYGSLQHSVRRGLAWIVLVLAVSWPLFFSLRELLVTEGVRRDLARLQQVRPDWIDSWTIRQVEVELNGESLEIEMLIGAAAGAVTEDKIQRLHDYILNNLTYPSPPEHFKLNVIVAPIEVFEREYYNNEDDVVEDILNEE